MRRDFLPGLLEGHSQRSPHRDLGGFDNGDGALAAWFVCLLVNHLALSYGTNALIVVPDDVVRSIFVGGLGGSVISLIPNDLLPGKVIATWRRARRHSPAWTDLAPRHFDGKFLGARDEIRAKAFARSRQFNGGPRSGHFFEHHP